jgi:hypothetical protein
MHIIHLSAATGFGPPEQHLIALAQALPWDHRTTFLCLAERGRCRPFFEAAQAEGFSARALTYGIACFRVAVDELKAELLRADADVLCCHGPRASIVGQAAARALQVPVVAVCYARPAECLNERLYEGRARPALRGMDRVVCASEEHARGLCRYGIVTSRVLVIPGASAGTFAIAAQARAYQELFAALVRSPRRQAA